jgi:hypothetical protein
MGLDMSSDHAKQMVAKLKVSEETKRKLLLLPDTATIVAAAILGVIGGVAGGVGERISKFIWPDKDG